MKSKLIKFLTLSFLFSLPMFGFNMGGCGGSRLVDPATSDISEIDLGTVMFASVHQLSDGTALEAVSETKTITNNQGFQITLEEAEIGWKSLHLISGGEDEECVAGHDVTMNLNQKEDLLDTDLTNLILKTQEIQKIAYCQYEVTLAPSPTTAALVIRHHEAPSGGGSGSENTFHMRGSWTKGSASGTFSLEEESSVSFTKSFMTSAGAPHPFHFHAGETAKQVTFGVKYDALFQGVDFEAQTEEQQKASIISNFPSSIFQRPNVSTAH